jgi:hypothetical protein
MEGRRKAPFFCLFFTLYSLTFTLTDAQLDIPLPAIAATALRNNAHAPQNYVALRERLCLPAATKPSISCCNAAASRN